jgi:Ca2+-binding EF-hand superfamily protein
MSIRHAFHTLLLLTFAVTGAWAQTASQMEHRRQEFSRRDVNRDGRLSFQEYGGHPGNFDAMDCDRNRVLNRTEFTNRYQCGQPSRADVRPSETDAFLRWDDNRDGVVSTREWQGTVDEFYRLDRNADGRVSRDEWTRADVDPRRYAGRVGAADRFTELDTNGDGVVSRREWRGSTLTFNRMDFDDDGVISRRELD